MASITLRLTKGSALTLQELDDNLNNLNNDKLDAPVVSGERVVGSSSLVKFSGNVTVIGTFKLGTD